MDETKEKRAPGQMLAHVGLAAWLVCVAGWLICAGLCLWAAVALEIYPFAYNMFFPAILLVLFCNIFLFLFVAVRWAQDIKRLLNSVLRICAGEAILLGGMYALGKYCM